MDFLKQWRKLADLLLVLLLVEGSKNLGNTHFVGNCGDGGRCRFRTCDPYRVKVMLYH